MNDNRTNYKYQVMKNAMNTIKVKLFLFPYVARVFGNNEELKNKFLIYLRITQLRPIYLLLK